MAKSEPPTGRRILARIEAYLLDVVHAGETLDTYELDEIDHQEILMILEEELVDGD